MISARSTKPSNAGHGKTYKREPPLHSSGSKSPSFNELMAASTFMFARRSSSRAWAREKLPVAATWPRNSTTTKEPSFAASQDAFSGWAASHAPSSPQSTVWQTITARRSASTGIFPLQTHRPTLSRIARVAPNPPSPSRYHRTGTRTQGSNLRRASRSAFTGVAGR